MSAFIALRLPQIPSLRRCAFAVFLSTQLLSALLPTPVLAQEGESPGAEQSDESIPIGPGGLGKKEGDICYSGHCQVCKIDSDGACLDCSDDPTCEKPQEPAPSKGDDDADEGE